MATKRPTKAQLDRLRKAMEPMRNFFAVQGRIGGKVGAKARWERVSAKDRTEGARKAALARWKAYREDDQFRAAAHWEI